MRKIHHGCYVFGFSIEKMEPIIPNEVKLFLRTDWHLYLHNSAFTTSHLTDVLWTSQFVNQLIERVGRQILCQFFESLQHLFFHLASPIHAGFARAVVVLHLRHLLRNHGRFDFRRSHRFLFVFGRLDVVFDELGIGISFDLFSLSFCFRLWRFFLSAVTGSGSLSCPRVILIKRKNFVKFKSLEIWVNTNTKELYNVTNKVKLKLVIFTSSLSDPDPNGLKSSSSSEFSKSSDSTSSSSSSSSLETSKSEKKN